MQTEQREDSSMFIKPHEDDIFFDALGMRLWEKRHAKVTSILESYDIKVVSDLGCNDGKFIRRLTRSDEFDVVIGLDLDRKALESAIRNSSPEHYHKSMPSEKPNPLKVYLLKADLLKDCSFLQKFNIDAITLIELIEHIEINEVSLLEKNIFGVISPKVVIVTTPNYEFNYWFDSKSERPSFRHLDHKFEWTRQEFKEWADRIAREYGYKFSYDGVGLPKTNDNSRGCASQIAIFEKISSERTFQVEENYLEAQVEELVAEIEYPVKRSSMRDDFVSEVNYAYSFVSTYSTNADTMEEDDDLEDFYNGFILVSDLLKITGLNKVMAKTSKEFLELMKEYFDERGYEISSDKRKIRLMNSNEDEELEEEY